eukprot:633803-Pelagomonas_calceolata.AAC.7
MVVTSQVQAPYEDKALAQHQACLGKYAPSRSCVDHDIAGNLIAHHPDPAHHCIAGTQMCRDTRVVHTQYRPVKCRENTSWATKLPFSDQMKLGGRGSPHVTSRDAPSKPIVVKLSLRVQYLWQTALLHIQQLYFTYDNEVQKDRTDPRMTRTQRS